MNKKIIILNISGLILSVLGITLGIIYDGSIFSIILNSVLFGFNFRYLLDKYMELRLVRKINKSITYINEKMEQIFLKEFYKEFEGNRATETLTKKD
jgi:hypothetical protein